MQTRQEKMLMIFVIKMLMICTDKNAYDLQKMLMICMWSSRNYEYIIFDYFTLSLVSWRKRDSYQTHDVLILSFLLQTQLDASIPFK